MHDFQNFVSDLESAQMNGKQEAERILLHFKPLIHKYKYIGNIPDDDLLCELYHAAFLCIKRFKCDKNDLDEFLKEAKEILSKKKSGTP